MAPQSESVEIVDAATADRWHDVRALFLEYGAHLKEHAGGEDALRAQQYREEVAGLPGDYGPPAGCVLVALVDGVAAGCVGLRALDASTAELKRLFVRSGFRGQSLGRRLVDAALDHAARHGARRVRLDTLSFMRSAQRLYRSLGFREIPPYLSDPTPGARCFELTLDPVEPDARLVEYSPDGAPDFERLNREWLAEFFHVEEKDIRHFADPGATIVAPGGQIFFVVEGARRVGTCAVIRDDGGRFELAKMAVESECRGKGYGQWLVTAAIAYARAHGAGMMYLLSDDKLADALRLYERMGFERRPFPGGTGYVRGNVYMELPLAGDASVVPRP
jgi:putative acetyltransferase